MSPDSIETMFFILIILECHVLNNACHAYKWSRSTCFGQKVKGSTWLQVGAGLECGIGVDDFDDWEAGDIIEAFNTAKKQRTLEEASASVTAALGRAGVGL